MKLERSLISTLLGSGLLALAGCEDRSGSVESGPTTPEQATPSSQTAAVKAGWLTNYEKGQEEAKANNKMVLIDFTGSDWCGWCKLLEREVFSKPEFKEYASKNLVLVEVDFPRTKPIPDATRMENIRLAQRYQIQGFPTIVVLNSDGKVVAQLGYMQGGADAFIAALEKLRKG